MLNYMFIHYFIPSVIGKLYSYQRLINAFVRLSSGIHPFTTSTVGRRLVRTGPSIIRVQYRRVWKSG